MYPPTAHMLRGGAQELPCDPEGHWERLLVLHKISLLNTSLGSTRAQRVCEDTEWFPLLLPFPQVICLNVFLRFEWVYLIQGMFLQ